MNERKEVSKAIEEDVQNVGNISQKVKAAKKKSVKKNGKKRKRTEMS